tara:strand:+ start:55 stop:360 length:306 start_codon:yes stop_codon:yes gene_type:complete
MSNESENKRIDYAHFAGKFTYGTGRGSAGNWTKAELKILLDEISRMYKREDELMEILSILEDRNDIDMSQFEASERDYAQGNGEIESSEGDGPDWPSGPNM